MQLLKKLKNSISMKNIFSNDFNLFSPTIMPMWYPENTYALEETKGYLHFLIPMIEQLKYTYLKVCTCTMKEKPQ